MFVIEAQLYNQTFDLPLMELGKVVYTEEVVWSMNSEF